MINSPQPHVTHVTHGGMHHAAASSYAPSAISPLAASSNQANAIQSQQLATSASNTHQQISPAYRMGGHFQHLNMYSPMQAGASAAHQIINSYAPQPPLYVDEAGGLYGHYGNAYGRYDGGYQHW